MAALTVGGFFISAALPVLFERLAPDAKIWDYFKGRKSKRCKQLRKLNDTFITISNVLDDAEEKEISDQLVRKWLLDLKDVFYDTDDLLAEIDHGSHLIPARHGFREVARSLRALVVPSGKKNFDDKLQEILDRLGKLKEKIGELRLLQVNGRGVVRHLPPDRRTTALVIEFEMHGRQADKEAITIMLMSENTSSINGLGVIAILGMGGLGKTTLAQLVYGQREVSEHFQPKAWVCVSENTDIFSITRNILKGFDPDLTNVESMTEDVVHSKLKDLLTGKRFLLVLDDIWNESSDSLDLLMRPLKFGLQGSRIIVTTRSSVVASLISTVQYPLNLLSDDESWLVFARRAFANEESAAYPNLVTIGKQIVAKCGRLPLALHSMGSLLRTERDTTKWQRIMKSDIWKIENCSILPALRLSYHWLS